MPVLSEELTKEKNDPSEGILTNCPRKSPIFKIETEKSSFRKNDK